MFWAGETHTGKPTACVHGTQFCFMKDEIKTSHRGFLRGSPWEFVSPSDGQGGQEQLSFQHSVCKIRQSRALNPSRCPV